MDPTSSEIDLPELVAFAFGCVTMMIVVLYIMARNELIWLDEKRSEEYHNLERRIFMNGREHMSMLGRLSKLERKNKLK
jgi:hypothetical protein